MEQDAHALYGVSDVAVDRHGDEELTRRAAARAYRPARVDFDDALRHDWLEFWYQPKLDLAARQFVGAEALARIRHPELGVLLPKSFLPALSDRDMDRLTEQALLTALRTWSVFADLGFNLQLAINLPLRALRDLPISRWVEANRPAASHWPGLVLELREDDVVRDLPLAQRLAVQLADAGLLISIDDFGARQMTLSAIRTPAFAEFKLDIAHVRGCAGEPAKAARCRSGIVLARRLGADVVAEGLETSADTKALLSMGCTCGQGVLIAPPLPADKFLDLLRRRSHMPNCANLPDSNPVPGEDHRSGLDTLI